MIRSLALSLAVSSLALTAAMTPASALAAAPAKAAPVSDLVKAVDIPYQSFTMKNGLKVIVHTDRKAPVVAVSVWYDVGSKHEPKGKTGFAHLFEHLMFNGSENAPNDFFEPLQQIGATDSNGTTWFDRTNYFETVPTSALDVALFLESDRMGHLLGAVTQEKLDNQRGVVQNEKRQRDNQPYGLVYYTQLENLLPEGHPYRHSTIGSMADLDSASLADVKAWFTGHYGPNNAIIVLAGDIDVPTAKTKMEKWFGEIPAGPKVAPVKIDVPTLPARKDIVLKDRVATTRIYRLWSAPGLNDPSIPSLDVGARVLGGLASSRLDNILVRDEQLAVRVTASLQEFAQLSMFEVTADVKPGVDADVVSKRLDEIISDFIAKGPTADEVARVATSDIAGVIGGLEAVGGFGGKATALAEGQLYSNDAAHYKKRLAALAAATPASVTKSMNTWLTRPVLAIKVVPGQRDAYQEAASSGKASVTNADPAYYTSPGVEPEGMTPTSAVDRSKFPDVGAIGNVDFPAVETATLSNGITVNFARRNAVPTLRMSLVFDAGVAADPATALGTQSLMLSLMDEGTKSLSSLQIAEAKERLGASITFAARMDSTLVSLYTVTPNLAPSLDLLADIVQNPAFEPKEVERIRAQKLTQIAQELNDPGALARRTLPPLIYGKDHPYGRPFNGTGDKAVVSALKPEDIAAFHNQWIRPEKLQIFVVGATSMAELKPLLEARFGTWKGTGPVGSKSFNAAIPEVAGPRIVLVDRPQSPQSIIYGGEVLNAKGTDDFVDFLQANDVLGGNFLSRINTDLRETKGWSYGVRSALNRFADRSAFIVNAPVQADKTGPSIAALKEQFTAFLTDKGVTPEELIRTTNGSVRELPGSYETSQDVLSQMLSDALFKRSFDYVETLASRYQAQTAAQLDASARKMINLNHFTWVVVGDKEKVLPQLQMLGMPITVIETPAADKK